MKIDTSGLSCPEPVLRTKKLVDQHLDTFEVVVDNNTALQNVQRFLKHNGYAVTTLDDVIKAKRK